MDFLFEFSDAFPLFDLFRRGDARFEDDSVNTAMDKIVADFEELETLSPGNFFVSSIKKGMDEDIILVAMKAALQNKYADFQDAELAGKGSMISLKGRRIYVRAWSSNEEDAHRALRESVSSGEARTIIEDMSSGLVDIGRGLRFFPFSKLVYGDADLVSSEDFQIGISVSFMPMAEGNLEEIRIAFRTRGPLTLGEARAFWPGSSRVPVKETSVLDMARVRWAVYDRVSRTFVYDKPEIYDLL